ncbi:MAG: type VI secretion protein IcmF/TssM N-terminal domain-containing protein [Polyangiaceae bacterium]
MATKLRARVDEIMSRLEMVLPVYLVLTKADLLAGFVESFSGLRKSERDQISVRLSPWSPLSAGTRLHCSVRSSTASPRSSTPAPSA